MREWNYANLSKNAKIAGGPEKYVEVLINSGKIRMIPWLFASGAAGFGGAKLIGWLKLKIEEHRRLEEEAREELIMRIKEYDKKHQHVKNR